METFFFVSGILGQLGICYHVLQRFIFRRTHQLLYLLICQSLLFAFICLRMAYLYAIFESNWAMSILGYFQLMMFALSTGTCYFYTVHFVCLVMQYDESKTKQMFKAAASLHILLSGNPLRPILRIILFVLFLLFGILFWKGCLLLEHAMAHLDLCLFCE